MTRIVLVGVRDADWQLATIHLACRAFGVETTLSSSEEFLGNDGILFLHPSAESWKTADKAGLPSLTLLDTSCAEQQAAAGITFTTSRMLPESLRSQQFPYRLGEMVFEAPWDDGVVPLATINGRFVWWVRSREGAAHYFSSLTLPRVAPQEHFYHLLGSARFLSMLPLIEFLRQCRGDNRYMPQPPRACIVFDDPNLHFTTYGYIDYQRLADHAELHGYHVAIATIPMDAYYIKQRAAILFQRHAAKMSLLFHGNNHQHRELLGDGDIERDAALVRQAISRVERLERVGGLKVDRIMAPPHGACSLTMMKALTEAGFEALCSSYGAFARWNVASTCDAFLGGGDSEVYGGLPLIPRYGMSGDFRLAAVCAAYLGKPIVFSGHHQDLREGLEILAAVNAAVQEVPGVRWLRLSAIARSQYLFRMCGDRFAVRMSSRRVQVTVPEGVTKLEVEIPWLEETEDSTLRIQSVDEPGWQYSTKAETRQELRLPPGAVGLLDLMCVKMGAVRQSLAPSGVPGIGVLGRRLLTELRDRAQPLRPRFLRSNS